MNIVKHSKAEEVSVSVIQIGFFIRVVVKDNGIGFQTEISLRHDGGFGLFSIRERLAQFGGHIKIKSKPGQGTCVTIVSPRDIEP
jgi:signal transduction histidine kinase